jgi:hypothetical protein
LPTIHAAYGAGEALSAWLGACEQLSRCIGTPHRVWLDPASRRRGSGLAEPASELVELAHAVQSSRAAAYRFDLLRAMRTRYMIDSYRRISSLTAFSSF